MPPFSLLVQSAADATHRVFDNIIDKDDNIIGKKIKVEASTLPELKRAVARKLAASVEIRTEDFYMLAWDKCATHYRSVRGGLELTVRSPAPPQGLRRVLQVRVLRGRAEQGKDQGRPQPLPRFASCYSPLSPRP